MKISLLIIAGGKSSRLGVGMLENILRKAQAQDFAEIFLCVEEELPALKILAQRYGSKILVDEIHDAGAMSGLANISIVASCSGTGKTTFIERLLTYSPRLKAGDSVIINPCF